MLTYLDFEKPIAALDQRITELRETASAGDIDIEPEGGGSITAGRAEAWKADFEARVASHRAEIRAETDKLGWSFAIHRTDRTATELMLALHARMGAPPPGAANTGRATNAGLRRSA